MERSILHCDLNNFFASVECRDNPDLEGHPVAVCGSVEDRHGIVLAKNELAKSFGVKTAEAVWQAQGKCPNLVIVPPHFENYLLASKKAKQIYSSFTSQVEPFGIDECYLDVTGSIRLFGSGRDIAEQIRARMKSELGLTVSVGVSYNKIFAKLGSDLKKPDATTIITRENYKQKVWPLPVDALLGVGKSTKNHLHSMGITTIGELAQTSEKYLSSAFGKAGQYLWINANGLDLSEVAQNDANAPPKSIGNSITCVHDLYRIEEVWTVLLYLAEKISRRMRESGLIASGIQLFVKDNCLHVFQHQQHLAWPSRLTMDLACAAHEMFLQSYDWSYPVRALGISGFALLPEFDTQQASFFRNILRDEKTERLEDRVEALRGKYGKSVVNRAVFMKRQSFLGSQEEDKENKAEK